MITDCYPQLCDRVGEKTQGCVLKSGGASSSSSLPLLEIAKLCGAQARFRCCITLPVTTTVQFLGKMDSHPELNFPRQTLLAIHQTTSQPRPTPLSSHACSLVTSLSHTASAATVYGGVVHYCLGPPLRKTPRLGGLVL